MKKFVFLIALFSAMLTSCTNNENKVDIPEIDANSEIISLQNNLLALNNEMFGEQIVTRASWWKYLLTAVADAGVGLLTGRVDWAISASTLAWTIFKEQVENDPAFDIPDSERAPSLNIESSALSHLQISEEEINDGIIHNQAIINLYKRHGENLFSLSEENLVQEVAEEVAELTQCSTEDVISDIETISNELIDYNNIYIESTTIDEYINHLKELKPEKSDELDVLKIILEGFQFVDAEEDNGEYASAIVEIIDNSNIATEMKNELKSSVAIANASVRLWNTNLQ